MKQKQKVINELLMRGSVDNFWAIKNYMLRLGAIIYELKKEGWVFDTTWGTGSEKKNYYYILKATPDITRRDTLAAEALNAGCEVQYTNTYALDKETVNPKLF